MNLRDDDAAVEAETGSSVAVDDVVAALAVDAAVDLYLLLDCR